MKKSTVLTAALIVCLILLGVSAWRMFGGSAGFTYADAGKYSTGDATVSGTVENLYIDWTEGRVNIEYHTGSGVTVSETADRPLSDRNRLRWWLDGSTLRIRYAAPGIRMSPNPNKVLTVSLPEGTVLKSAEIGSTSADLNIPSLAADGIRLESTSGDINASTLAGKLTVSSTSGSISIRQDGEADTVTLGSTSGSIACTLGSAKTVSADSTSGGISLTVYGSSGSVRLHSTSGNICPDIASADQAEISSTSGSIQGRIAAFGNLKAGATSGNITVKLPTAPGLTCKISTAGGSFSSGLALTKEGDTYTCGDGSSRCEISTTSGDIRLEQAD